MAHILADLKMGLNTIIAGPPRCAGRYPHHPRRTGSTVWHNGAPAGGRRYQAAPFGEQSRDFQRSTPTPPEITKTAENLRKLLLAVSDDLRVMIIRLARPPAQHADRWIACLPDKQMRIATETLQVYSRWRTDSYLARSNHAG